MKAFGEAHVALYPSRTAADGDSEGGAPVTLIEAGWIGIPSVVSNHDDLPLVTGGEGNVVVSEPAVDAWAAVLRELYADRDRLVEMAGLARGFVREHHSPTQNALAREHVYDTVAA